MRKVGFLAEPVDPRIEAIAGQDWLACNALGVLKMSIDVLCRRAVLEVDDLNAAIDVVEPDVLIVDANCWGAMSMADAGDIPWLVFSPFPPTCGLAACRRSVPACGRCPVCSATSATRRCARL